ncbi:MAG: M48 family metallopeptidase, partial [Oscillospiraceae bacterium]|nr:M48 family metallopeptidase [Oscillospiraceae bacterium]
MRLSMDNVRILYCGGRKIKWLLTRKKVKNVNMRIKPDGIVYISASGRVPVGYIEDFIRQKSDFIFASFDKFAEKAAVPELPEAGREYKNGDTVCYFGDYYTLCIVIDTGISYASEENVAVKDKEIVVTVRYGNRAGKVLEAFYAEEMEKFFRLLNKRTCEIFREKEYSVPFADLQIRK